MTNAAIARRNILAPLLHDLTTRAGPFESYAECSAAIKTAAAQLRLPYDATTITDAIVSVERTRRVVRCPGCYTKTATPGDRVDWPGGYNERLTCGCGFVGERSTRLAR